MTNDEVRMTNEIPISNDEATSRTSPACSDAGKAAFDLEERTAVFGERAIQFAKTVPLNRVTAPLISQVVRAATSVGANYTEANDAETKKDFRHIINRCRQEAKECKHWFRMIVAAAPQMRDVAAPL